MEDEEKVTLEEIEKYPNLIFNLTKISEEQLTTALYSDLSLLEHLLNSNLKDCFSDNHFEILVREVIEKKSEDINNNNSNLKEEKKKVVDALLCLKKYYTKESDNIIK